MNSEKNIKRKHLLLIRGKEYDFQEREQDPVEDKDPGWLTKTSKYLKDFV